MVLQVYRPTFVGSCQDRRSWLSITLASGSPFLNMSSIAPYQHFSVSVEEVVSMVKDEGNTTQDGGDASSPRFCEKLSSTTSTSSLVRAFFLSDPMKVLHAYEGDRIFKWTYGHWISARDESHPRCRRATTAFGPIFWQTCVQRLFHQRRIRHPLKSLQSAFLLRHYYGSSDGMASMA